MRKELREAVQEQYRSANEAHAAVGNWIGSVEKLNTAQKQSLNGLLGQIEPGLSLDSIDKTLEQAIGNLRTKIGL